MSFMVSCPRCGREFPEVTHDLERLNSLTAELAKSSRKAARYREVLVDIEKHTRRDGDMADYPVNQIVRSALSDEPEKGVGG